MKTLYYIPILFSFQKSDEVIGFLIEAERYGLNRLKECCLSILANDWKKAKDRRNSWALNHICMDKIGREFLSDLIDHISKNYKS